MMLGGVAALTLAPVSAFAAPDVVVSIKPLHSLVAAVMKNVGTPSLIVKGTASAHTYNLRPSDAQALQKAQIVFWMGHGLEAFLEKPLEALAGKAEVVEMEDVPGLEKLAYREGGPFEAHDHGGGEHAEEVGHDHGHSHEAAENHEHDHGHEEHGVDMHMWLDPMNAKAMARAVEQTLAKADPANAGAYAKNLAALEAELDQLDAETKAKLAPVADKPFVVFHDAYQYFEHRYKVRVAGSVTVSPENMPGAERISAIHDKIAELKAVCVFAEPQFESKLVSVVMEGTSAKSAALDPHGATIPEGPDLYPQLIRNLADSMVGCLSQS
ncbi:zinc ABC transporter substrate-binding protein ZnuA [Rhizobium sp. RU36D]|uniref:zinc ABC transporter substrate-binding protein ZnuA n=1 Tax=Rhizobium sp. RU36D TaxID=1907415 RepID=UPI002452CB38|nr:zinc ABC transporter substrate-binding protein ZnuA [Rhizobium sp. RU36D]